MAGRRGRKNTLIQITVGLLTVLLLLIGAIASLFLFSQTGRMLLSPGGLASIGSGETSENVSYRFGNPVPQWTGARRVTVLLLGIDQRGEEQGPWRTDTMMLVTLDPTTLQAGVLSIPRDLWVPIPGYTDNRINTAHFLGDLYNHPGGGPALAVETVEHNFGIPIDYYVRLNFQGFIDVVNLIGGIDIYVEQAIHDPDYPDHNYGYDPLYIEAGWHHFDGELALKYARTRHGSSDFARARRQQQVLLAILERVTSLELLPQLATRTPEIYETLRTSIQTDLAPDQALALAALANDVDRGQIRFGVIDGSCTQNWTTPQGGQVLIPIRECIREVRDYIFGSPVPGETGVAAPTATPEVATLAILNGTDRVGLARSTSDYLQSQGLAISRYDNADRQDYAQTLIILNHDKPQTAERLLTLLGLPPSALIRGTDPNAAYDITIILGADYPGPPSTP